jgi:hypothetical protein
MKASEYKNMILSFLAGSISAIDFVRQYQSAFFAEASKMDRQFFDILENLWEDVEAFSPEWSKSDEEQFPWRITEPTLRQEADEALAELNQYMAD